MSGKPLTSRDYKGVRRAGFDFRRWQQFGAGLATGLLGALIVYVGDHRNSPQRAEDFPTPRPSAAQAVNAAAADTPSYDFYKTLPKFEVVVPEQDRDVHRVDPDARIDRPGTYFLQAGSYNNEADAERIRAQLSRQGIEATVQRVAIDADVWFRVRVGPLKDLDQTNRIRRQLHNSSIDTLVIRVGD